MDGVKLENFSLPSPTAIQKGTDPINVLGKEYLADVFEWEGTLESGKVGMKCWRSNQVPGMLIQQQIDYRDDQSTLGFESVVSMELPQS